MVTLRRFTRDDAKLLREKLGFESDGYVYQNAKGREVVLCLKAL